MGDKKKVLVVDDESSITKMMSMLLETRGYDVDVASSGKEAIEKAVSKPDLILLDLLLPDVEGYEVCRRLRESHETRHIPIIIISVKYLFEDKVEGLYLGADDYVTKPFDYEELFARMEAVMRRNMFFDESAQDKDALILELRHIIKDELVEPFYQPVFWLKSFKLLGFEGLSRPPKQNILSNPEHLFRVALKFGLYSDLELLCWDKILRNRPTLSEGQKLFLNCNPYLVESPRFFKIKSIFENHHFSPKDVILEITERSAISDFSAFYERLKLYREHEFGIAVDDVGGGYASLESIVEIKPSVLKIDAHLINGIYDHSVKRSLIKFIVSFCKENNIISIAEGIERKEDLEAVMQLGIDAGQGYLLSRPVQQPHILDIYKDMQVRLNIQNLPFPQSS